MPSFFPRGAGGVKRTRPQVRYLDSLGGGAGQRRRGLGMLATCLAIIGGIAYVAHRPPSQAAGESQGATQVKADVNRPLKVGLQVGHLDIANVPDELSAAKWDFGASFYGVDEVDVNRDIANRAAALLRSHGITVDVLDATLPAGYVADALVAIHADGLEDDTSVSGFRIGSSYFDASGKSVTLAQELDRAYASATGMTFYPTISDNMTQYFAFNYQKFQHAVAASTPSALIECGFLSNSGDRGLLTNHADRAAQGIAQGVMDFLDGKPVSGLSYPTTAEETGQSTDQAVP